MEYENDSVNDLQIAYIGGGSRGWAWTLMGDLALEEKLSGTVKLYDIDYEAAHDNEIIGNRLSNRNDVKGKWKYEAVKSLKEALIGADFVIISILPGTLDEMESDVHAPEEYGIYQSVGDTVGPGGIIRALRTIPMFVEIAEAVKEYSPEAWVINYTNPLTICVRTLYKVFPGIKAYGCCHEVFDTQKLMVDMLKDMKGIEGVSREEIKLNIMGVNHFTWVDQASYKGINLLPLFEKFADKYYESGFFSKGENWKKGGVSKEESWKDSYFYFAERVKFDLFKQFGIIAAAGDRHLAEFFPSSWYLKDPERVENWKFHLTPVSFRKKEKKRLLRKGKMMVSGEKEFELKTSDEEGVDQIKAILGIGDMVTNVNLPNRGQLKEFPENAVVETNAVFRNNQVRPVNSGKLPGEIHNLQMTHVYNQEAVIEAVLNKDIKKAFRVFLNDPQVNNLKRKDAEELFDKMVANTKKYLPWL